MTTDFAAIAEGPPHASIISLGLFFIGKRYSGYSGKASRNNREHTEKFGAMLRRMWWERLNNIVERDDLDIDALAKKANVRPKTLYAYLAGDTQNPRGNVVERLAKAVGVSEQYLRFGDISVAAVDVQPVPLLSLHGVSAFTDGKKLLTERISEQTTVVSVDDPQNCFCVTCEDTANAPRLSPGDILVFDTGAELKPGNLVLVSSPDEKTSYIGRYKPRASDEPGNFVITFENEYYPDKENTEAAPLHILARAIKVLRDID